jgi:hypothetical protein
MNEEIVKVSRKTLESVIEVLDTVLKVAKGDETK